MPSVQVEVSKATPVGYRWKTGHSKAGVSAEVAAAELSRIRDNDGGGLLPERVVEEARVDSSPLHPCFEWDNRKAATSYRLHQARNIINSVVVIYAKNGDEERREIRAFVHLEGGGGDGYYQETLVAMTNSVDRAEIVERALREARLWSTRYAGFHELATIYEAIDEAG